MATPTIDYTRGAVVSLARCQDCTWTHFACGSGGPRNTRAAVRYHVSAKSHRVEVEIRRFTSYEDRP